MSDAYTLLKGVLAEVEKNLKRRITAADLAGVAAVSSVHLQRLFRMAFERPIAGYIRSRKLAASLEDLVKTDLRIIDIAMEYGFEYEQSYIRAFKREYGVTPNEMRTAGHIVKIAPPLQLVEKNKMGDGLFFGPEFVMVPDLHLTGRLCEVPFAISEEMAPRVAKEFWKQDRGKITNRLGDDVYIGLTRFPRPLTDFSYYMPSVPVAKHGDCPPGLHEDTFAASLCAKFHYIGKHHYFDINADLAKDMYEAINAYRQDENAKYSLVLGNPYFERICEGDFDGIFCKMEWFTPAFEKKPKNLVFDKPLSRLPTVFDKSFFIRAKSEREDGF